MIEDTSEFAGVVYGLHLGDYRFRYIGQTIGPLTKRFNDHKWKAENGKNLPVYDWMRKHGVENIQVCAIETFCDEDIDQIDEREIFHIAQARFLYTEVNLNVLDGGQGTRGYRHTEETKQKMSLIHSGLSKPSISETNRSRVWTLESRAKLSASKLGRPSPIKGIPSPKKGIPMTDEQRARISKAMKGGTSNHTRYHTNRGIVKPDCDHCVG